MKGRWVQVAGSCTSTQHTATPRGTADARAQWTLEVGDMLAGCLASRPADVAIHKDRAGGVQGRASYSPLMSLEQYAF